MIWKREGKDGTYHRVSVDRRPRRGWGRTPWRRGCLLSRFLARPVS
jgi:hypothetical protein